MVTRGDIWWVDLGPAIDSGPAKRRPVVVIQADAFNRSRLATVTVAAITSRTQAAELPGNVFLPAAASTLPRDSVVNVTQLVTIDRARLTQHVGPVPAYLMSEVDAGLRRVLAV